MIKPCHVFYWMVKGLCFYNIAILLESILTDSIVFSSQALGITFRNIRLCNSRKLTCFIMLIATVFVNLHCISLSRPYIDDKHIYAVFDKLKRKRFFSIIIIFILCIFYNNNIFPLYLVDTGTLSAFQAMPSAYGGLPLFVYKKTKHRGWLSSALLKPALL